MNLASKTFRNNKTGETVKVIDAFENIAILENKQKIDVRTLMDTNQFTEQIDPSSFFNNQNAYNALAEKIKTIPVDTILDESITPKFGGEVQPAINESAIIQTTEEDEMAELARKYGVNTNNEDAVSKQNEAFQRLLNPEEKTVQQPVTRIDIDNNPQVEVSREYVQPVQTIQQPIEDPIITMFKNVKRNVNFNISIEVSNKIPRLDFIEMMEDSYETSIIDFLADEFTNQVLNNPSQIKETIKKEIHALVYGNESSETVINEVSQAVNEENKEKEEVKKDIKSKQTVKERTDLISKLNSISSIEFQLKGETSKTVISAANKRIKELKNNTK
jgi:hypothetical protein